MIHKVISEVDMGAPILVCEIPFVKGVDEDIKVLEHRIHEVEWKAVIEGIGMAIQELHKDQKIAYHTEANVSEEAG